MNERELKEALKARLGSKRAASDAIEAIFDVIIREVARGGAVRINSFGIFELRKSQPMSFGSSKDAVSAAEPRFIPSDSFRAVVAKQGILPEPKATKAAPAKRQTKTKSKKQTSKRSTEQENQPPRTGLRRRTPSTGASAKSNSGPSTIIKRPHE